MLPLSSSPTAASSSSSSSAARSFVQNLGKLFSFVLWLIVYLLRSLYAVLHTLLVRLKVVKDKPHSYLPLKQSEPKPSSTASSLVSAIAAIAKTSKKEDDEDQDEWDDFEQDQSHKPLTHSSVPDFVHQSNPIPNAYVATSLPAAALSASVSASASASFAANLPAPVTVPSSTSLTLSSSPAPAFSSSRPPRSLAIIGVNVEPEEKKDTRKDDGIDFFSNLGLAPSTLLQQTRIKKEFTTPSSSFSSSSSSSSSFSSSSKFGMDSLMSESEQSASAGAGWDDDLGIDIGLDAKKKHGKEHKAKKGLGAVQLADGIV